MSLTNASLETKVGILLLINPVFIKEQFWGCEKLVPDLTGVQAWHRLALKKIASSQLGLLSGFGPGRLGPDVA